MPILQSCPSSEPNSVLAASSLGRTMETAGLQEKRQGRGPTGPLALLHARPRPTLGSAMSPTLPDG